MNASFRTAPGQSSVTGCCQRRHQILRPKRHKQHALSGVVAHKADGVSLDALLDSLPASPGNDHKETRTQQSDTAVSVSPSIGTPQQPSVSSSPAKGATLPWQQKQRRAGEVAPARRAAGAAEDALSKALAAAAAKRRRGPTDEPTADNPWRQARRTDVSKRAASAAPASSSQQHAQGRQQQQQQQQDRRGARGSEAPPAPVLPESTATASATAANREADMLFGLSEEEARQFAPYIAQSQSLVTAQRPTVSTSRGGTPMVLERPNSPSDQARGAVASRAATSAAASLSSAPSIARATNMRSGDPPPSPPPGAVDAAAPAGIQRQQQQQQQHMLQHRTSSTSQRVATGSSSAAASDPAALLQQLQQLDPSAVGKSPLAWKPRRSNLLRSPASASQVALVRSSRQGRDYRIREQGKDRAWLWMQQAADSTDGDVASVTSSADDELASHPAATAPSLVAAPAGTVASTRRPRDIRNRRLINEFEQAVEADPNDTGGDGDAERSSLGSSSVTVGDDAVASISLDELLSSDGLGTGTNSPSGAVAAAGAPALGGIAGGPWSAGAMRHRETDATALGNVSGSRILSDSSGIDAVAEYARSLAKQLQPDIDLDSLLPDPGSADTSAAAGGGALAARQTPYVRPVDAASWAAVAEDEFPKLFDPQQHRHLAAFLCELWPAVAQAHAVGSDDTLRRCYSFLEGCMLSRSRKLANIASVAFVDSLSSCDDMYGGCASYLSQACLENSVLPLLRLLQPEAWRGFLEEARTAHPQLVSSNKIRKSTLQLVHKLQRLQSVYPAADLAELLYIEPSHTG